MTEETVRQASLDEVPIIDLASPDRAATVARVREACTNSAFFYLLNHDVSPELLASVFAEGRSFFEQGDEAKRAVLRDKYHRGYLPLGITKVPGAKPDLKESFDYGVDVPEDHPDVVAGVPMMGPNQWPEGRPRFRAALEAYMAGVTSSGMKVLELIAESLELETDFFTRHFSNPAVLTRVIHYPKPDEQFAEYGIGALAHTDYGLVTILAPDPAGGLEIQLPSGEWVAAPFVENAFVVNLGDLMAHWTNEVYNSNPHRVINRLNRSRMSVPTFLNPDYGAPVECIPTCTDADNPPKYAPVLAGEYVTNKLRQNQGYKAPAEAAE